MKQICSQVADLSVIESEEDDENENPTTEDDQRIAVRPLTTISEAKTGTPLVSESKVMTSYMHQSHN